MSINRRQFVGYGSVAAGAAWLARARRAAAQPAVAAGARAQSAEPAPSRRRGEGYLPVVTPNGSTLPWRVVGRRQGGPPDRRSPSQHEFAPGLRAECWGYNGGTPGPTIEAVEGDRLRIYVTNRLPEPTTVHWHGVDRCRTAWTASPGSTSADPGRARRSSTSSRCAHPGTFMYHPHFDEMTQIALGMAGMFVVHPQQRRVGPQVDRDFVLHDARVAPRRRAPGAPIRTR